MQPASFPPIQSIARLLPVLVWILVASACRNGPTESATALKIQVAENGIYGITASEISDAGLAFERLAPDALRLSHDGNPVPFLVQDGTLLFYGQASDSRYTPVRTYLLEAGTGGATMERQAAPQPDGPLLTQLPRQVRLEENYEYVSDARISGGEEPWFWQSLPLQGAIPIEFSLAHVADGAGRVEINLYGSTYNRQVDPDHTLALAINELATGEIGFDGQTIYTGTLPLPAGTLQSGQNMLSLDNLPEEYLDLIKLNWIQVTYNSEPRAIDDRLEVSGAVGQARLRGFSAEPLIFDVAQPGAPVLLEGWQFDGEAAQVGLTEKIELIAVGPRGYRSPVSMAPLRQSNWRDGSLGADLIILTTDTLAPALNSLVDAREEQGLRVTVVPVQDVYDAFGFGQATPQSINRFLTYAYENWQEPTPRYLLLVGDATIDFRGYLRARPEEPVAPPDNVIPPYLVDVSFGGETVSDARLADVDGDFRPDLAVGRWPVDSLPAVRSLVERTLAYEDTQSPAQAIFAADGTSDEFRDLTERLLEKSRFPEETAQVLNGPTSSQLADIWNEGSWLVTYAGHGSLELWGKEDVFSVDAVEKLESGAPPPVVVQLTCLSGLFAHPEIQSLSEVLLTQQNGPVLVIGATSLTLSTHQEPFAVNLLQALQDSSYERVGDALLFAKQSLDTGKPGLREISDTFGLIGDPSTFIQRPNTAS